jgi:arginine repressor
MEAESHARTAPRARHQRALARRIKHLERRVNNAENGTSPLSYDLQELDALRIADQLLTLYRLEQTGQETSTAFLLQEACARLLGEATVMTREELVQALHTRALLLESLGEP